MSRRAANVMETIVCQNANAPLKEKRGLTAVNPLRSWYPPKATFGYSYRATRLTLQPSLQYLSTQNCYLTGKRTKNKYLCV